MLVRKIKTENDIIRIANFLNSIDKRALLIFKEASLNILKHTKEGKFICRNLTDRYQLIFDDISNGLNIEKAFIKGYSATNTLGIGLNVLLNVSDEVEIVPKENGTTFIFSIYKKEKKEYCLFHKQFENIEAFLKTSPYLTITTSGDCGIFEKVGDRYLFALWDIEGHGNREVYNYSKELKKYILAFKHYRVAQFLKIINYLFINKRGASMIIGEIEKSEITLFQFGNVNFISGSLKSSSAFSIFGTPTINPKRYQIPLQDIILFSDGVELFNNKIEKYDDLEKVLKNKNEDDASIMVIKVKNGTAIQNGN
jgi:anti-sigma regulatory factor (Ser/Thr protein kinase)